MTSNSETLNIIEIVRRQFWLIVAAVNVSLAGAVLYWAHAPVWYESRAKILVSQRDPGLATSGQQSGGEVVLNEDILANHMEIVSSRRIVEAALTSSGLDSLPSIVSQLRDDVDAVDYVIEHLKLTRGGDGSARDARSLQVAFQHLDPEDSQAVLEAVVSEYQSFLGAQLQSAMSSADLLIREVQADVEAELKEAEQEYVETRVNAPVLFQGEGSSNVYFDRFRRLNEELLDLQSQESGIRIRLEKVQAALQEYEKRKTQTAGSQDPVKEGFAEGELDLLALIDSDSLERLGMFAGLQIGQARSAEFQASQPIRLEEARAQYTTLLNLRSQEQRLRSDFGAEHPDVVRLQKEIALVEKFIDENAKETAVPWEQQLGPEALIAAYVGFLKHDLASLDDKKRELVVLAEDAEKQAKLLVEYELKDEMLRSKIDRQQALFDGIVEQLRNLNLASGMSGYVHELLEAPQLGEKIWPSLPLCGVAGIMLGIIGGLVLAVANDSLDPRFRSPNEFENVIQLPLLANVGQLNRNRGIQSLVSHSRSMEGEVFRSLRTVLIQKVRAGEIRTLGITSPLSQDGKSTVL
ncbi:MAG: hypothetical protein KDA89_18750, partial [Planctomycetaceae bacterium]|nr:hypothetical protein [Planctomycetaceae bacterium]